MAVQRERERSWRKWLPPAGPLPTHGTVSCARMQKCKCDSCRMAVYEANQRRQERHRQKHGIPKLVAHYCGECPRCAELDRWLDEEYPRMAWPVREPRSIPPSSWLALEEAFTLYAPQGLRGRGAIARR